MKRIRKEHLILALILFVIFLLRFPSLYEPYWYGDEGIFAAVGRNLNLGGILYQTAWDNKPPMIYLTYAAIFKYLGVSMFSLRLVTVIAVLATATAIYEIAQTVLSGKRALAAALIFGILTSLRLVEGNLALTEIYMVFFTSLAMLVAIKRKFDLVSVFLAGLLFAIGSLYKQVGALEAAALGIFLFLSAKNFVEFVKKGFVLGLGFCAPYALTIAYFFPKHLVGDWIFAAYTYYRIYLGESPKYAAVLNVLKFMPILAAVGYGLWKNASAHPRGVLSRIFAHPGGETGVDVFHLILLWSAFSFLGSYFSGRTYGHYLVQATPALALLSASFDYKIRFTKARIVFAIFFAIPLLLLTKLLFWEFLSGGPASQVSYYKNFIDYSFGGKSLSSYNDYFDSNSNRLMALSDFFASQGARGAKVYIWGDWPWLYAIDDFWNPSRYETSFHVFGVPNGKEEVIRSLADSPPKYIVKTPSSIGYFPQLEKVIFYDYTLISEIDGSQIFRKVR